MPFFDLYADDADQVLSEIGKNVEVFCKSRPDMIGRRLEKEPYLLDPHGEAGDKLIIPVDGGSAVVHFRWISACFAHAVSSEGTGSNPGLWTRPKEKGFALAFTLYRERAQRVSDYLRTVAELRVAFRAAHMHTSEKPLLLLDGSLANMYRFIARTPPRSSFFTGEKLLDGAGMKEEILDLLDEGVDVVAVSKDTRVKYMPAVERKVYGAYPGRIVAGDPVDFAGEDVIDRGVVTSPPYIWLLLVRFADNGRVYRVEIPVKNESRKDLKKARRLLSILRASVSIDEPRMMITKRLGYPYPLGCVDALARLARQDREWMRHEVGLAVRTYFPHLKEIFDAETGEAVHTR